MKAILDVSAAFAVVAGAPASGHFLPYLESATQVLSPDLFYSEATNAAWNFHHIEGLSPEGSVKLAEGAIQLVDIFFPSESLWEEALALACKLAHPVYDCFYLILAQQQEATLLTADKRLIKIARGLDIPAVGPQPQGGGSPTSEGEGVAL